MSPVYKESLKYLVDCEIEFSYHSELIIIIKLEACFYTMRRVIMIRKHFTMVLLLIAPLLARAADPTIGFNPSRVTATAGETVSVDITMQDFPLTQGGGIRLTYNPSVLQVSDVAMNDSTWNFVTKVGSIDNQNGVISDILFSNFSGVSGAANIATVQFEVIKNGNSQLRLTEVEQYQPFLNEDGQHISVAFKNGSIRGEPGKK